MKMTDKEIINDLVLMLTFDTNIKNVRFVNIKR
jgi:hypothetical protein